VRVGAHARCAPKELHRLLLLLPCQVAVLWLLGHGRRHEWVLGLWCLGLSGVLLE
jgi:hypothetical protein